MVRSYSLECVSVIIFLGVCSPFKSSRINIIQTILLILFLRKKRKYQQTLHLFISNCRNTCKTLNAFGHHSIFLLFFLSLSRFCSFCTQLKSARGIKGSGNQLQCVFCWFQRMFCKMFVDVDIVCFWNGENFAFAFRIYRCNLGLARHSCSFIISKFTIVTHTYTLVLSFFPYIHGHFEVVSWLFSLYSIELLFCFLAFQRKRNGKCWKEWVRVSEKKKKKEKTKDLFVWQNHESNSQGERKNCNSKQKHNIQKN